MEKDADQACYQEQNYAEEELPTQAGEIALGSPGISGQAKRGNSRNQESLGQDIAVASSQVQPNERRE